MIENIDFQNRIFLKSVLARRLFDDEERELQALMTADYPSKKIFTQIKKGVNKSYELLPSENDINIHLFPAVNSFIRDRMNGADGYTPESGIIFLFLDCKISQDSSFFQEISGVTAHEYNHSVRFSYFPAGKFYSLGDVIVNEGLAENFRMRALDLPVAPWAKALDYEKSRKIFAVLQDKLDSKDDKLYKDLFFDSDDYPLWAGYAVGFYLVSDFLQNRSDEDWSEIMKTDSETIIKKAGWC